MRAILLYLGLCAACHPLSTLDPPPFEEVRSIIIVAMEPEMAFTKVYALAVPDDGPVRYPGFSHPLDMTLYAAGFSCSLSDLGFTAGPVAIAPQPTTQVRPSELVTARLVSGQQTDWRPTEMNAELADLFARLVRLEEEKRCVALGRRLLSGPPIAMPAGTRILMPLNEREILAGTSTGAFYRVSSSLVEPFTRLSTRTPNGAAFKSDDGTYWFIGRGGDLAYGHDLENLSFVDPSIPPRQWDSSTAAIDGPGSDSPIELFRVTTYGGFYVLRDGSWHTITEREPVRIPRIASVSSVKPGEAYAVLFHRANKGELLHYTASEGETWEALPEARSASVVLHSSHGTYAGTEDGYLAHRTDEGWEMIDDRDPIDESIRVIHETTDGILYGAVSLRFYDPQAGLLCRVYDGLLPAILSGRLTERTFFVYSDIHGPQLWVLEMDDGWKSCGG